MVVGVVIIICIKCISYLFLIKTYLKQRITQWYQSLNLNFSPLWDLPLNFILWLHTIYSGLFYQHTCSIIISKSWYSLKMTSSGNLKQLDLRPFVYLSLSTELQINVKRSIFVQTLKRRKVLDDSPPSCGNGCKVS